MTSPPPSRTMNDTDAFRFGDLAEDIARLILEEVIEVDLKTGWAFARLCRGIQDWVEPVLYRHVYVDSIRTMKLLYRTILSHPSKEWYFFLKNVKSLALNSGCLYSCKAIVDILDACAGVKRLRMKARFNVVTTPWISNNIPPSSILCAQPAWNRLRPKHLEIQDELFWSSIGRQKHHFRTLSPPDVVRIRMWSWDTLRQLTPLTHLCIESVYASYGAEWMPLIVPHLPSALRVCVVFLGLVGGDPTPLADSALMIEEFMRADHRVVAALHGDEYRVWNRGAPGLNGKTIIRFNNREESGMITDDNFWRRAEEMVAKLRGEKAGLEEDMKDLTI
ncbi:hypothetical protein DFP72DRAFT_1179868 [Ephemerocybe angulata]|uniref:Uncharacterized protein n=1 Tax=Ephemerocybe angulata TaxID=980116 RepID=A0A8H6H9A5_9AGAR|nr:hypothetical protein DFP72DRAFT_1179868 [Tulosesus angulatus]